MRKLLAVWLAKLVIIVCKLLGKKGSATAGAIALKLCPDLLERLSCQVKKQIIAVLGTNGKTTTNNLAATLLAADGGRVVCNRVGANMLYGVVTAFVDACRLSGNLNADYACLEIDEFAARRVFPHMKPDVIVITNLFRDQLDRFGEIDTTIKSLQEAIGQVPTAKLILNADDPLVAALGMKTAGECVYYGVGENTGTALRETKEGRFCRFCGAELSYRYYHYSQLGDYACPNCDFKRPEVSYNAVHLDLDGGIAFEVGGERIHVDYRGFYNVYNILAAYAVSCEVGKKPADVNRVLSAYRPQIGRMEPYNIGKQAILNLSKNPAGFNQAISAVIADKRKKSVIVVINDNDRDGNDISWIWDVDFERLKDANAVGLYASGIRRRDVCVRFKYAELSGAKDEKDLKEALIKAKEDPSEVIYVLVNYTALFPAEKVLKEMSQEERP